jgi:glucose/arabinose dehydrogenase
MLPSARSIRLTAALALAAVLVVALGATPRVASAAPQLVRVGTFTSPVYVTGAPGDRSRLFVVERAGVIKVVQNGIVRTEPFLTIPGVTTGGPNGLLSIAFPPGYPTSGLFYAFYTDQTGIKVAEFKRATANRAAPTSRRVVLSQPHPPTPRDHYGGQLQFDSVGRLYISIGDGGPGGDPQGDAQNLGSLFGKILRINPRPSGSGTYRIPPTNPYVGVPGARPEIWASGLRNPWRFSFDRATGDLVVGDVGEDRADEIDFAPAASGPGRGANFGWNCFEGFQPFTGCSVSQHTPPFMEKPVPLNPPDWCGHSLIGGYVAGDASLPFNGRYVYGDFCSGEIRSVSLSDPASDSSTGIPNLRRLRLVSFGEDACGRLYVVSLNGPVHRIQEGTSSSCP